MAYFGKLSTFLIDTVKYWFDNKPTVNGVTLDANVNIPAPTLHGNELTGEVEDYVGELLSKNGAKDLTTYFADEIAEYDNQWQWIKARIEAGNFTGINIGDYLTFTAPFVTNMQQDGTIVDSYNVAYHAQVAGINPYYGARIPSGAAGTTSTSGRLGNHIDFFCKECCTSENVYWSNEQTEQHYTNNGTAAQSCPYVLSQVFQFYQKYVEVLPEDLKAVLMPKGFHLEKRYDSIAPNRDLNESNGRTYNMNIGKCWGFSEFELVGAIIYGTKPWSAINAVQYPLFKTFNGRHFVYYEDVNTITDYANIATLTVCAGDHLNVAYWDGHRTQITSEGVDTEQSCALGFRIGVPQ